MSTENTPDNANDVDLDTFSAELFGRSPAPESETTNSTDNDTSEDVDAHEDDTQHEEVDNLADDEPSAEDTEESEEEDEGNEEAEPEEEVAAKPKPKKNRFQERIDELTAKARTAERELAELKSRLETPKESKPNTPKQEDRGPAKPDATALNEDGSEKYPLGEFDAQYQADLIDYMFEKRQAENDAKQAKQAQERNALEAAQVLKSSWDEKATDAQERYPDFEERGRDLVDDFSNLDANYAQYLTETLMSMDYGPDVFYYLSTHPEEAKSLAKETPLKATLRLGKIEAKFANAEAEKQLARPKVSKAPTPPSRLNKGTAVASKDLDDLDVFAKELFRKGR